MRECESAPAVHVQSSAGPAACSRALTRSSHKLPLLFLLISLQTILPFFVIKVVKGSKLSDLAVRLQEAARIVCVWVDGQDRVLGLVSLATHSVSREWDREWITSRAGDECDCIANVCCLVLSGLQPILGLRVFFLTESRFQDRELTPVRTLHRSCF